MMNDYGKKRDCQVCEILHPALIVEAIYLSNYLWDFLALFAEEPPGS